jgi:hypothetical protein
MRAFVEQLPLVFEEGFIQGRQAIWEELSVNYERWQGPQDLTSLHRGLPNDRCQSPHWGYLVRGQLRAIFQDREEVIQASQVFYLAPDHSLIVNQDTELVQFSPKGSYKLTVETIKRNLEEVP